MSDLGPGWTGSYHSKEGFQVSRRELKKDVKRELARGAKQRDCAMIILLSTCIHVHNVQLNVGCNLIVVRGMMIA
jgi:hypothetical protein